MGYRSARDDHGFFQHVTFLPGDVQFALEPFDFGSFCGQARFATPRKGHRSLSAQFRCPAVERRVTDAQILGHLQVTLVRLVREPDGFELELFGVLLAFGPASPRLDSRGVSSGTQN